MANEVLFAGGKLDSVALVGTTADATTSGAFDSSLTDAAIQCPSGTAFANAWLATLIDSSNAATSIVTGETGWFHFDFYTQSTFGTVQNLLQIEDASGNPWLAFRTPSGSGTLAIAGNTGTGGSPTWTTLGSTFVFPATRTRYDIKVTLGSPHSVEIYQSGTLVTSGTFTAASFTAARQVRGTSTGGGFGACWWSQLLVTRGLSTVGAQVPALHASGAGSNSDFTGAYTDINEAATNDATTITSATANQVSTFAYQDPTLPSGYTIASVFIGTRVKNDGTAPVNMQAAIRSGGANYFSGNLPGISGGFAPSMARNDNDPATGAAWTQSGVAAAEFGAKSIT